MTAWPAELCRAVPVPMQRASGTVRISAGATGLRELEQRGCLRACFPRAHGGALEAVIVNTAGGIADGDQLELSVTAGQGAAMVVTTPSAERIYRARPGAAPARMTVRLRVAAGATLAFLPQETILFDACALDRRLEIDLEAGAGYLGIEALVFGRQQSGETLQKLWLRDTIRIRSDGRLLMHDAIRLQGDMRVLSAAAAAGGSRAVATIVLAGPDAAAALPAVRDVLGGLRAEAGASSWNGMLVVRLLAADGQALRDSSTAILAILRSGQPLPRVWSS